MINILHDELCGVYFEVLRSHLMILRNVVYRKLKKLVGFLFQAFVRSGSVAFIFNGKATNHFL